MKGRLTKSDMQFATSMAILHRRDTLRLAENFTNDPLSYQREQQCKCAACMYLPRIAGQAMTKYNCGLCEKECMHHNTAVPKLCFQCAQANELCMQCGGDREMREKRRNFPQ